MKRKAIKKIKANVSPKTKDKYLHVEILGATLYIYADNCEWDAKVLTRRQMGTECNMGQSKHGKHFAIPLNDFVK